MHVATPDALSVRFWHPVMGVPGSDRDTVPVGVPFALFCADTVVVSVTLEPYVVLVGLADPLLEMGYASWRESADEVLAPFAVSPLYEAVKEYVPGVYVFAGIV